MLAKYLKKSTKNQTRVGIRESWQRCFFVFLLITISLITNHYFYAEERINVSNEIKNLRNKDMNKKLSAIDKLSKSKDKKAISELVKELKAEKRTFVKTKIVESLSFFQDPDVTKELVSIVKNDTSYDVRYTAIYSLGYNKDQSAIPVLIEAFMNEKEELGIRLQAANSLANYPTDEVFNVFVNALDNPVPAIKKQALVSLYLGFGWDKDRVLPYIKKMLNDKDTEEIAKQYLENLGVKIEK